MSLAISSAIPNDLSRYSATGLRLNAELTSEANYLGSALQHFEATCRESGYALRVSYLADELRSYAKQTDLLDQWVGRVGVGFFVADSAQKIIRLAEFAVGAVLVKSLSVNGRNLNISLAWVKTFGLKPSAVRTFLSITAPGIGFKNLLKYTDKVIGKAALVLGIVIKWSDDFQRYTGTELISALVVDAVFIVIVAKVATVIGGIILGAVASPGILVAAAAVAVALGVAVLLDVAFENLGIRDWAINGLNTALNWTIDRARELPELGAKTVQALDEKVFMPIARGIATGVDNVTSFVDSAAQRLRQKLQDTADAAGRVISDKAIKPTSGEALELRQGLHRAMDGWGTDEDAIMRLIVSASDAEKVAILNDTVLLERLHRELSKEELMQVAKELVNVSNLPAGSIQDTVALLAMSLGTTEQNTARLFLEGRLTAYYIEDLRQPDDVDGVLKEAGYDPNQYTLYLLPPDNTELMLVQKDFGGTAVGDSVFVSRAQLPDWLNTLSRIAAQHSIDMKTIFVHEANHALNPVDISTPLGYFESEFLAYWVAGFEAITDPDKRAQRIKDHILTSYPHVKEAYDTDPDVRKAIDAYTRPKGTLTNEL